MKAIIVGPAYPLRGGIANFNLALCRAMQYKGIETSIVSFSMQYPGFLFPGKTQFEEGPPPENVKISSIINSVNPFSWFKAGYRIYKEKPEYIVIAFWMPFMGPALGTIAWLARRNGVKVIAITHNVIPHEHHFYDRPLLKYFIKSCNGYVTLAKSVLNDLSQFTDCTQKIFIPHPIYDIFGNKVERSSAIDKLSFDSTKKYLLFFGLIRHYKGLDLMLNAMALEKIRKHGVVLIVAGEFYEDKASYLQIIEEQNLGSNVIIVDKFIPSEDIKYYFSVADMVVQPYHTATQSGVTQIAYHFDVPMLVTNVGGLAEIVPDKYVGYVTEKTPESIADAIDDFYSNNRFQDFSLNVAKEKSRFSWESFVDGISDLASRITLPKWR